ncbi:MAG: MucB/RseB C-terminal domain-containing protein [Cellvibrionaceae bacterium]
MARLLTFFLFFVSTFLSSTLSSAERYDRARELLGAMSRSIHELNYRGLFTYEVGGVLDNYKIIHQVRGDAEYERLQKLNGSEKEILRSGFSKNCLNRGDQFFRGISDDINSQINSAEKYLYHLTGRGRVAGRDALTIQVLPKDAHRYGYVFYVDELTSLPLQVLMIDSTKKILERIQFVDLEVGISIDETELLPRSSSSTSLTGTHIECRDNENKAESFPSGADFSWNASWVPSGYTFLNARKTRSDDNMLTYSDGLSSFSIVIGPNRLFPAVEGRARMGGMTAFIKQHKVEQALFSITVLGEIPMVTAQKIAESVEKR